MHVDPEISICNIKLKDYYGLQLYRALTPGHPFVAFLTPQAQAASLDT